MNFLRRTLSVVALSAAALMVAPAQSATITGTGSDFSLGFSQVQAGNTLSAFATFDITSYSTSQIIIAITIQNTSTLGGPTPFTNAGLNSFGLGTNPLVAAAFQSVGSSFGGISNDDIPSLGNINLCFFAANNCNGGAQGSLLAVGASDSFTVILTGDFTNGLAVNSSGIKFQTSGGSFEFGGGFCTSPTQPGCNNTTQVPEPATLLLLSLGTLIGFGIQRRRRA